MVTTTELLIIVGVTSQLVGLAAYLWGHADGSRPWREEQHQREIERRLLGKDSPSPTATGEPAVIRSARVAGSHSWSP